MLQSKEGENVPSVTFRLRKDNAWECVASDDFFRGKTIVLFALPGAYTPTCSSAHLPRYNELAETFRKQGVDKIACLSVNDSFVLNAWAADQRADQICFLPDAGGEFTQAMGMLVDKTEQGLGKRSWRYSMLVRDGVIEKMFIEEEGAEDPFRVSDADTMLRYINPNAKPPARVSMFSKPGCPHCARARRALRESGYGFEEIALGEGGISYSSLFAVTGRSTTPQVFVDGSLIGSADELEQWLAEGA